MTRCSCGSGVGALGSRLAATLAVKLRMSKGTLIRLLLENLCLKLTDAVSTHCSGLLHFALDALLSAGLGARLLGCQRLFRFSLEDRERLSGQTNLVIPHAAIYRGLRLALASHNFKHATDPARDHHPLSRGLLDNRILI